MWPSFGGGGVNVQQPLPSSMLAGTPPYDLPQQQASPTFVLPLAPPLLVAWTPWMNSGALPYGLPLQQVGPIFVPPLAPPPPAVSTLWMSSSDQQPLAHSFHTMAMVLPAVTDWDIDSGASNHITSSVGNLISVCPPLLTNPSSIIVGNGSSLSVTSVGNTALLDPFYLNNVLVTSDIIQNLIFVRRFTTDNCCSMEFDTFGIYVKDLSSWNVILGAIAWGPSTRCACIHVPLLHHVLLLLLP
jgi:hypothetical protein